jgi:putative hydrolase of the HAD superfamily
MFSLFKKALKKEIKLICFDLDNTLCDFATAESEAEAFMAELIYRDIKNLLMDTKKNNSFKSSLTTFDILKIFNDVKKEYLYRDFKTDSYSRMTWFKVTLEQLDEKLSIDINSPIELINSKNNSKINSQNNIKHNKRNSRNKFRINSLINPAYYEKIYWEQINKKLKNYPGTFETLQYLKSGGFKLATITDSDGLKGMKDFRLKILGLDKYFDYIITGDDIGLNKPAIENWNKLLELSKLRGSQCMMVGDHPDIDLITAKKLGFITVWTKQNLYTELHQKYVDFEIRDIKGIVDILNK